MSATPFGHVPTSGRGSMPFALVHGESLVAVASWALGEAGAEIADFSMSWADLRSTGRPLVLHDPLCPLTPVPFLVAAIEAAASGAVVVGVRPVTDTVKTAEDGAIGETVDRETLWTVASPIVLPGAVVAALPEWPDDADFAALSDRLRASFPVSFLEAPPLAARVWDESGIEALQAFEQRGV